MDVLSDVLRVVRLSGAVFFTADFSSPWAIESPMPAMLAAAVAPQAEPERNTPMRKMRAQAPASRGETG